MTRLVELIKSTLNPFTLSRNDMVDVFRIMVLVVCAQIKPKLFCTLIKNEK